MVGGDPRLGLDAFWWESLSFAELNTEGGVELNGLKGRRNG